MTEPRGGVDPQGYPRDPELKRLILEAEQHKDLEVFANLYAEGVISLELLEREVGEILKYGTAERAANMAASKLNFEQMVAQDGRPATLVISDDDGEIIEEIRVEPPSSHPGPPVQAQG